MDNQEVGNNKNKALEQISIKSICIDMDDPAPTADIIMEIEIQD